MTSLNSVNLATTRSPAASAGEHPDAPQGDAFDTAFRQASQNAPTANGDAGQAQSGDDAQAVQSARNDATHKPRDGEHGDQPSADRDEDNDAKAAAGREQTRASDSKSSKNGDNHKTADDDASDSDDTDGNAASLAAQLLGMLGQSAGTATGKTLPATGNGSAAQALGVVASGRLSSAVQAGLQQQTRTATTSLRSSGLGIAGQAVNDDAGSTGANDAFSLLQQTALNSAGGTIASTSQRLDAQLDAALDSLLDRKQASSAATTTASAQSGDLAALQALHGATATQNAAAAASTTATVHNLQAAQTPGTPAFTQEMGDHVAWLSSQDIKQASIQLNPRDLGPINVNVQVNQNHVDVSFAVQHPGTVHALQQTLPQLDTLLAQHGLSLGQAQVGQQHAGQQDGAQGQGTSSQGGDIEAIAEVEATTPVSSGRLLQGAVDDFA